MSEDYFDPRVKMLPPGWHRATVQKADFRSNSKGTGKIFVIQLWLEEKRRTTWHTFNLTNPNQWAERRGREQFSSFLRACDVGPSTPVDAANHVYGQNLDVKIASKNGAMFVEDFRRAEAITKDIWEDYYFDPDTGEFIEIKNPWKKRRRKFRD